MTTTDTITTEVPQVFDVDTMADWLTTQRGLTAATFLTAVARVGRRHGPHLLVQAVMAGSFGKAEGGFSWHSPALAEQAKATASVWSDCDRPSWLLNGGDWTALFDVLGYTVDGVFADQPEEPIRLYRGATEEGKHGMAWTSDLAMAEFFATEYSKRAGVGKIYTAVIAPDHLLACITTRGEHEYVVDPAAFDPEGWEGVEVEEYITV